MVKNCVTFCLIIKASTSTIRISASNDICEKLNWKVRDKICLTILNDAKTLFLKKTRNAQESQSLSKTRWVKDVSKNVIFKTKEEIPTKYLVITEVGFLIKNDGLEIYL